MSTQLSHKQEMDQILKMRKLKGRIFEWLAFAATIVGALLVILLLGKVVQEGASHVNWKFLTRMPSRLPKLAGIKAALFGSVWLVCLTALVSIPLGVGAGVYLEEYVGKSKLGRFIQLNISNLAGVPSIVFGMLGLYVFVRFLNFGHSLLAGACTLALLVLPVIVVATQEALKAIPNSLRMAAYALGATKWQTIRDHLLPTAVPGITTGTILALSRALGETAPLILVGALAYVPFVPVSVYDNFTALPIQIFNWASRPQGAFHELAASAILVLLCILTIFNSLALYVRKKFSRRNQW